MKNIFSKIRGILVVGVVIRLFLMPITLHPDIWAISFSQYLFSFKGVVNIYDYLANLPNNSLLVQNYGRNFFTYPPLGYYTLGIFGLILRPLFNADFSSNLAAILPKALIDGRIYWHLFLTKFPYLFFDFSVLWLLLKMFDEEKQRVLAATLWIFNPLSLYTSYMIGQFDIFPVFFTVLSLYLVKQKKMKWAALSLGVGGAFKMFPLFFIPFLAVSQSKKTKESIKLLLLGLLPYLFFILPFAGSVAFRQNVLFSNQSQKMLFAKISISGAEYLSLFVVFYVFLLLLSTFKKLELWKWFLLVMLLFFSVTHYHPQWFLWISPLLIIEIVNYKKYFLLPVCLLIFWLMITFLFEPSLSISLFAPVSNSLINVKPLSEQLNRYYDIFTLKSLIRSIAAGVSLGIAVLLFKHEETA